MDYIASFSINSNVILIFFELCDISESLLEVKGISHKVKQESKEEFSPIFFKSFPSRLFNLVNTVHKLVAPWRNF